jgi:hypothetical protein
VWVIGSACLQIQLETLLFAEVKAEVRPNDPYTVHVINTITASRLCLACTASHCQPLDASFSFRSILEFKALMPKRTFEHVEPSSPPTLPPSSSSPAKKIHASSTPASRSTATYGSSAFSTPYTPSVYSIPADSPTNPLGLKRRVNNLTLPKATPFSKHVALRFQLITAADPAPSSKRSSLWDTSPDSSPSSDALGAAAFSKNPLATQYASEGTYRTVQAPLSYTFRHLRALILFLFSRNTTAAVDAQRPRVPGHLFVVHHGISIGDPGEIVRGRTRVKLSRARDPYYSSRSLADLIAAADSQGQGEDDLEDEEEDASWRWEGEDDFTLGHVWESRVRDPKRGIIYVRAPPPLQLRWGQC